MPADLATMKALLDRVEGGTGADRELWCDLLLALLDPQGEGDKATRLGAILMAKGTLQGDGTESIDAALALVERVLPGWGYVLSTAEGGGFYAELCRDGIEGAGPDVLARSQPLAILAALLKAKIAEASDAVA